MLLGNNTNAQAKPNLFSQDSHSDRLAESIHTESEQPQEIPLNEGENITKNDYTDLLCAGIFAGVLLIAGVKESIVRKRLK